jgi:hypothetical protein
MKICWAVLSAVRIGTDRSPIDSIAHDCQVLLILLKNIPTEKNLVTLFVSSMTTDIFSSIDQESCYLSGNESFGVRNSPKDIQDAMS